MEFLGLAVEGARVVRQRRFRRCDQAEKIFRFLGLLYAATDDIPEILFRDAFIGFAVVGADAGATAGQLIDEPVVVRSARDAFKEPDDAFAKTGGALLKIERMPVRRSIFAKGPRIFVGPRIFPRRTLYFDLKLRVSLELGG